MRVSAVVRRGLRAGGGGLRAGGGVRRCSAGACKAEGGDAGAGGGGGEEGVVVGARQQAGGDWALTAGGRELDADGALSRQLQELQCALRPGHAFALRVGERSGALACIGAGSAYSALEALDEEREAVRCGVGAAAALLAARGLRRLQVDGCGAPDAAAEGAALAVWRFQEFKACEDRQTEPELALLAEGGGTQGGGAQDAWHQGAVRARAQNWARWLSDMPANKLAPVELAQAALDVLCPLGVRVEARDRYWLEAHNMRCVLAVARGSCEPPVFLELAYDGPGAVSRPVLLAAKGVTFDSGGLCLKRPQDMLESRGSMAGAAVVLGAFRALAELRAPCKLRAVIPLCENMVSGQCMKLGDVVPALNGLNVQIEDTDMEGRLLLADALVHGQAQHRPALVVTVGTMTRGAALATGGGAFGAFATSDTAWAGVQRAGARAGDRGWRLPLWDYYQRQLANEPAVDLRNKGSGRATPCLAAAFLKNFVCGEWTHWDITGVARLAHCPAPPYLDARRMTGRPTRTLTHFLQELADPQAPHCDKP